MTRGNPLLASFCDAVSMRDSFILAIVLGAVLGATPALAVEKAGDPGTNVEMPFLIAPMSKDGKLLGYAYISSKLVASSQRAALEIRDKIVFIQDAFVRDVNAASIATAADPPSANPGRSPSAWWPTPTNVGGDKPSLSPFGDGDKALGFFSPPPPKNNPKKKKAGFPTKTPGPNGPKKAGCAASPLLAYVRRP